MTLNEKAMKKPRKTSGKFYSRGYKIETIAVQRNKITEVGAKRKWNLKPLLRRPGRISSARERKEESRGKVNM